ncbi:hypothetical protein KIPB_008619, partial [Kipferlia bialata]|eukprot:g8619.t1
MASKLNAAEAEGALGAYHTRDDMQRRIDEMHRFLSASVVSAAATRQAQVDAALGGKADIATVNAGLQDTHDALSALSETLATKADAASTAQALGDRATVSNVNEALATKVPRKSVARSLRDRADLTAFEQSVLGCATLAEVNTSLGGKVDVDLLNAALERRPSQTQVSVQADQRTAHAVATVTSRCARVADDLSHVERVALTNAALTKWAGDMNDLVRTKDQAMASGLSAAGRALETRLNTCAQSMAERVMASGDTLSHRADSASQAEAALREAVAQALDDGVGAVDREIPGVDTQLDALRHDLHTLSSDLAETEALAQAMDRVRSSLDVCVQDAEEYGKDIATRETQRVEETQDDLGRGQGQLRLRLDALLTRVQSVSTGLMGKANAAQIERIRTRSADLASVCDMCALFDAKPNVADVNDALEGIAQDIATKAEAGAVRELLDTQESINHALSAESTVARWVWTDGRMRANKAVVWSGEMANACPDLLVWAQGKSTITVTQGGLYEVSFGFFGGTKPTLQLHVDGEPMLSAVPSADRVVKHPPRRSGGGVCGHGTSDVVALQPGSKVSVLVTQGLPKN